MGYDEMAIGEDNMKTNRHKKTAMSRTPNETIYLNIIAINDMQQHFGFIPFYSVLMQ